MKTRLIVLLISCFCFAASTSAQNARQEDQNKNRNKKNAAAQVKVTADPAANQNGASEKPTEKELTARKAELMAFVDEHHPDLRRLFRSLEEKHPEQFRKAVRTLSRSYDRLQTVKDKDPEKHEIGLRLWKVHSRVEYVQAQMALNGPEEFEERLTNLLRQQEEIKLQMLRLDIRRQEERLKKLRATFTESRDNVDELVERKKTQIINSAQKKRSKGGTNSKSKARNQGDQNEQAKTNDKKDGE